MKNFSSTGTVCKLVTCGNASDGALRKIQTASFQESFCAGWMPVMNWLKSARLKDEARQKINVGWEQAKAGQLRTPEQSQEILAERKAAWKSSRGG